MRCPTIVGRDRERQAIDQLLIDAAQGRGGVLALVGEAGIGKTRLVEYGVDRALALGLTAMLGRTAPRSVPLRPVAEMLLDGTRDQPPPLDDSQMMPFLAVIGALIPHWLPHGVAARSEHPLVLAEAVLRSIMHIADDRGAVVILEDLHWGDDETDEVVSFLAGRLRGTPVAMLLTARDDEARPAIPLEVQQLHLGPLSVGEVAEMAQACARSTSATDVEHVSDVDRLTEISSGVPLLIEDALGAAADGLARFPAIVEARLGRLGAEPRRAVETAAVLGLGVDPGLLATSLGWSTSVTIAACEQAVSGGLFRDSPEGLAFRHALTRDAVLATMSSARLAFLAAVAGAAVLSAGPSTSTTLVDGAELLTTAGDIRRAADVLISAAAIARGEGRLDVAETALRRAASLDIDEPTIELAIHAQLAELLIEQGRAGEAAAAARRAITRAEGRDHAAEAAAYLVLARCAALQGQWESAGRHTASARQAARDDRRLVAEAAVLEARIALRGTRSGSRAVAAHLASAAAVGARRVEALDLECEARLLGGLAARTTDLDASIALLGQALNIAEDNHLGRLRLEILNELGASELLRDASADRLERALTEADRAGAVGLATSVRVNLAAVYLMTARFVDAIAVAEEVETAATLLGLDPLIAVSHLHRGQAAGLSGDRATMDRHLRRAESLAPDDRDLQAAAWAVGRGLNAIIAEDHVAARRAFVRAREIGPDVHAAFLNPFEGPALLLRAVDSDLSSREADGARERIVRGARYHELWTGAAMAVCLGTAGEHDEARAQLRRALTAGAPYPIFSAITCRLVAEAQQRDGWGDPVALLRRAEPVFNERGLTRIAAVCRGLLKEAGAAAPRRRGRDVDLPPELARAGVTTREAEVLDLLIDRLTNRQIAERLYCSPRTVEKHVASLRSKLHADRAQLAEIGRSVGG